MKTIKCFQELGQLCKSSPRHHGLGFSLVWAQAKVGLLSVINKKGLMNVVSWLSP